MKNNLKASLRASFAQEEKIQESRQMGVIDKFAKAEKLYGTDEIKDVSGSKIIRHTFSITEHDLEMISACVEKSISARLPATKSQVIRAAVETLYGLKEDQFIKALMNNPKMKVGRPVK